MNIKKKKKKITTINNQVYEVLKENIISGELKPGERIQEIKIAEELNVSRSPVRSAINKLIGEGFVESIPNKSVCVRKFSERDIIESYEFRLIIEKFAVEKIACTINDDIRNKLREFRDSFKENGYYDKINDYLNTDVKFHAYLIEKSGNKVIQEALEKVSMMISPFRVIALSRPKRFYASIEEHCLLIDSLMNGDVNASVSQCEKHLNLVKEELLRSFKGTGVISFD